MLTSYVMPMLTLAALYALISLAWVAVFQATGVFNLATGSFILVGPYFVVGLTTNHRLPLAAAIVVGLLLAALVGAVSYYTVLKPLAGRPILAPIIVTLGASIIFDSLIQIFWGGESRTIPNPIANDGIALSGGRHIPLTTIIGICLAFAFALTLIAISRFTRFGIRMRAAAENPLRAAQVGINIHRMAALGWAVGAVAAAGAGVLYAVQNSASPELATLGFKGLAPAMLGGFQSPGGALIGAFVVAVLETTGVYIWGGTVREIAPFVVLLVILLVRPQGLFGKPTYMRV